MPQLRWQKPVRVVHTSSSQDGDMIVESPMKVKLLLRYKEAGKNVVGYWATTDGGLTWKKQKPIVSSPRVSYNPISAMIRNAHPDARLLVSSEPKGQQHQYRRILLLGDHGPVTRPAAEANNLGDRVAQMKALAAKQSAGAGRGGPRGRRGPGGRGAPGQRGSGQPGGNTPTP